jgi:hypothetical protein
MIPTEQVLQDPEKYEIEAVTTVDGEVIEFREGVSIQHSRIVGWSKDGTLKRIPLSEVKSIRSYGEKIHIAKSVSLVVPICLFALFIYAANLQGAQ